MCLPKSDIYGERNPNQKRVVGCGKVFWIQCEKLLVVSLQGKVVEVQQSSTFATLKAIILVRTKLFRDYKIHQTLQPVILTLRVGGLWQ